MKSFIGFLILIVTISTSLKSQESENITLLAHWDGEEVPFHGAAKYNDVWGFEVNGEEFGCIGSTLGTHIFHLGVDHHLAEVGFVPGRFQGAVVHRDFAFHEGYLYAVCDQGSSSLQVIDVSELPQELNVVLDDTTYLKKAHNITVDKYGEKLYASGASGVAMKVFDISVTPENPEFLLDFEFVEYVHDVYARRDTVFLNAGNQGLLIYDFTNGELPQIISALDGYPDEGYNHSGWMSGNGQYYAFADETLSMRMKIVDITDPSDLEVVSLFNSGWNPDTAPHNLEWVGDKIYVSHYYDGLQVFDVSDPENPIQYAYYDTYPLEDVPWRGAWGVHVMPSGRILISDRQTGFYMFNLANECDDDSDFWVYPNPSEGAFCVNLTEYEFDTATMELIDYNGRRVFKESFSSPVDDVRYFALDVKDIQGGIYYLKIELDDFMTAQKTIMIY